MRVRPVMAFRYANYPKHTALDPSREYDAVPATNQPRWKEEGKVFVQTDKGSMLLYRDDYEVTQCDTK